MPDASGTAMDFLYTTYIRTTPDKLWQALTVPALTRRYWGLALHSDWAVGSTIDWEVGEVTVSDPEQVVLIADPPHTLSYTWHTITREFIEAEDGTEEEYVAMSAEPRSLATFTIESAGEQVKLTILHTGLVPGGAIAAGVAVGWPMIAASLKSLLETGQELRFEQ